MSGPNWPLPPAAAQHRDQLLVRIRDAFAHVSRAGGMSLQDAYAADSHGYLESDDPTPLGDNHWWEVDLASEHSRAEFWNYLDAIGFRYYLPALMSFILTTGEDPWGLISHVSDRWDGVPSLNQMKQEKEHLLDPNQRACVAAFFAFMDAAGQEDAIMVRNNRWYDSLDPADERAILGTFDHD